MVKLIIILLLLLTDVVVVVVVVVVAVCSADTILGRIYVNLAAHAGLFVLNDAKF